MNYGQVEGAYRKFFPDWDSLTDQEKKKRLEFWSEPSRQKRDIDLQKSEEESQRRNRPKIVSPSADTIPY